MSEQVFRPMMLVFTKWPGLTHHLLAEAKSRVDRKVKNLQALPQVIF
jgi:hypothetical protein